jgi:hypothetical protein
VSNIFKRLLPKLSLIAVLMFSNVCYGGFGLYTSYVNTWDKDNNYGKYAYINIYHQGDKLYSHVEFNKYFDDVVDDGTLELQNGMSIYKWGNTKISVTHELLHDFNDSDWEAELTPTVFTKLGKNFKVGVEMEIDYYGNDELEISQIEIEPTIKWSMKADEILYTAELEAPTMRLYSNNDAKKDFEFEEIYAATTASFPVMDKTVFILEGYLYYDLQAKELAKEIGFSIQYDF